MRATMKALPVLVVFIYLQCSFALNDGPSVRCTRSDPCRTRGYICDIPKGMCVKYSTPPPKRSILSVAPRDEDPIFPPDLSTLNPDLNIKLSATALNSLHGRNRRDVLDTMLAGQGTMLGSHAGREGRNRRDVSGLDTMLAGQVVGGDVEGTKTGRQDANNPGTSEAVEPNAALEEEMDGSIEDSTEGSMEGSTEDSTEGSTEGSAEGSMEGSLEGSESVVSEMLMDVESVARQKRSKVLKQGKRRGRKKQLKETDLADVEEEIDDEEEKLDDSVMKQVKKSRGRGGKGRMGLRKGGSLKDSTEPASDVEIGREERIQRKKGRRQRKKGRKIDVETLKETVLEDLAAVKKDGLDDNDVLKLNSELEELQDLEVSVMDKITKKEEQIGKKGSRKVKGGRKNKIATEIDDEEEKLDDSVMKQVKKSRGRGGKGRMGSRKGGSLKDSTELASDVEIGREERIQNKKARTSQRKKGRKSDVETLKEAVLEDLAAVDEDGLDDSDVLELESELEELTDMEDSLIQDLIEKEEEVEKKGGRKEKKVGRKNKIATEIAEEKELDDSVMEQVKKSRGRGGKGRMGSRKGGRKSMKDSTELANDVEIGREERIQRKKGRRQRKKGRKSDVETLKEAVLEDLAAVDEDGLDDSDVLKLESELEQLTDMEDSLLQDLIEKEEEVGKKGGRKEKKVGRKNKIATEIAEEKELDDSVMEQVKKSRGRGGKGRMGSRKGGRKSMKDSTELANDVEIGREERIQRKKGRRQRKKGRRQRKKGRKIDVETLKETVLEDLAAVKKDGLDDNDGLKLNSELEELQDLEVSVMDKITKKEEQIGKKGSRKAKGGRKNKIATEIDDEEEKLDDSVMKQVKKSRGRGGKGRMGSRKGGRKSMKDSTELANDVEIGREERIQRKKGRRQRKKGRKSDVETLKEAVLEDLAAVDEDGLDDSDVLKLESELEQLTDMEDSLIQDLIEKEQEIGGRIEDSVVDEAAKKDCGDKGKGSRKGGSMKEVDDDSLELESELEIGLKTLETLEDSIVEELAEEGVKERTGGRMAKKGLKNRPQKTEELEDELDVVETLKELVEEEIENAAQRKSHKGGSRKGGRNQGKQSRKRGRNQGKLKNLDDVETLKELVEEEIENAAQRKSHKGGSRKGGRNQGKQSRKRGRNQGKLKNLDDVETLKELVEEEIENAAQRKSHKGGSRKGGRNQSRKHGRNQGKLKDLEDVAETKSESSSKKGRKQRVLKLKEDIDLVKEDVLESLDEVAGNGLTPNESADLEDKLDTVDTLKEEVLLELQESHEDTLEEVGGEKTGKSKQPTEDISMESDEVAEDMRLEQLIQQLIDHLEDYLDDDDDGDDHVRVKHSLPSAEMPEELNTMLEPEMGLDLVPVTNKRERRDLDEEVEDVVDSVNSKASNTAVNSYDGALNGVSKSNDEQEEGVSSAALHCATLATLAIGIATGIFMIV